MKNWSIIAIIIIIAAVAAGFYVFRRTPAETTEIPVTSVPVTTPVSTTPNENDFVRNLSIKGNDIIKSPLVISGEARGTWYFEASFPVKIRDQYGVVIATVPAQAQGDWMTTDFVPFKATINFTAPTTTRGFVVLEKDNPSGDPERDQAIIIPVRFK